MSEKFIVVNAQIRRERGLYHIAVFIESEAVGKRQRRAVSYCMTRAAKSLKIVLIERDTRVVYVRRRERLHMVDDYTRRAALDTKAGVTLEDIRASAPPCRGFIERFCKCSHALASCIRAKRTPRTRQHWLAVALCEAHGGEGLALDLSLQVHGNTRIMQISIHYFFSSCK